MNKTIKKIFIVAALAAAFIHHRAFSQAVVLSGTNYFQDFDSLSSGLPGEWLVYTNAKASQLGNLQTFNSDPTASINAWASTSFGFKNLASTNNTVSGTNFVGTEVLATQQTTANRALGVRATSNNDPGNAFVLKVADTLGFGKFKLDVDMLLLNVQTRSNNWTVDFGISPDGSSPPTSFTVVSNNFYGTNSTVGPFGATHRIVDFGNLLDDQPGPIWIRIVNLQTSSGSGSRPTIGIDNFNLSWTNVPSAPRPPVITSGPSNINAYVGDQVVFSVANSGTAPFTYQWYHPDLNTPVGGNAASYTIPAVSTGDAGNYYVIISNGAGSVTSSPPAVLTVGTRTPIPATIYQIRTNQDHVNWSPIDVTNFYTVTGVVISRTNMTTAGNASFFIEDTNSLIGIDVFIAGDTTTRPAYGDIIQVTGPVGQFNGVLEMNLNSANPTHIVNNLGPSGYDVPPKPFDFNSTNNVALMETNFEGSLVVVQNAYFPGGGVAGSNFVSGATLLVTNNLGQTFPLFIDSRLTDLIGMPIPVSATVVGYMTQFKNGAPFTSGYEIVPTYAGAIITNSTVTPIPLAIVQSGTNVILSWSDSSFSLQSATNVVGPYTTISTPNGSPYTNSTTGDQMYFRLIH